MDIETCPTCGSPQENRKDALRSSPRTYRRRAPSAQDLEIRKTILAAGTLTAAAAFLGMNLSTLCERMRRRKQNAWWQRAKQVLAERRKQERRRRRSERRRGDFEGGGAI